MPRGASPKREREYEELKQEFHQEHRYPGREEEVAARIVNKQRSEHGETKGLQQQQDRQGHAPDSRLPVRNYQRMTVDEITAELDGMDERELEEMLQYERAHANRKTLVEQIDRRRHHSHP